MRSKIYSVLMVVVVVAIVGSITMGDVTAQPKPKDLRDFLIQPPNSIYQEYGYSEETLFLYNILTLKEVCQSYAVKIQGSEARIKSLEEQVAELVEAQKHMFTVPDSNDITPRTLNTNEAVK